MDKHEVDRLGYDLEELYFSKLNQELIAKLRAKMDRARAELENRNARAEHWMRCPKCGEKLKGASVESVTIDQCTGCRGVFFDAGELALVLHADNSSGISTLRRLLVEGAESRA